ncbi:TetR family transcriptional regulator [Priestia megaterium]|uniref:TetR family transcriptional regulator n=1 Tax=Priestia megaterium TaxID=1404 RepID=UPI001D01493A
MKKHQNFLIAQGYRASSISDIMHKTGLRKGGIYNHFENKEKIMLIAFPLLLTRCFIFSLKQ